MAQKDKAQKDSSGPNYVNLGKLGAEIIKNEKRFENRNLKHDYTFHPKNFFPYSEKPQLIAPDRPFTSNETLARLSRRDYKLNNEPISETFIKDRIMKSILSLQQIPKDKYQFPVTSAQEIGWYSRPLIDNSMWDHHSKTSPITDYVNNYFIVMKINPYKLKNSSLKMK